MSIQDRNCTIFVCRCFILLGVITSVQPSVTYGDLLTYSAPAGSAFLTRGSVIELDILNASGLTVTSMRHQIRGGATAANNRDFSLFYRSGAYDELVEVAPGQFEPAHQVAAVWEQISFVPNIPQPAANSLLDFTLNLNAASGGTLPLNQGLYSFYFFSSATIPGENDNGIRVVSVANTTGTVLATAAGSMDLIGAVSKSGAAFTAATTIDRVPGQIEISFIPEPISMVMVVCGLICLPCARRLRRLRIGA